MVDNSWIFNIETYVFTILKTEGKKKLQSKFPNINFTTSNKVSGTPIYPTVYIHENEGMEKGMDLENCTINAVLENIQVEVITDTSRNDCKKIASVLTDILKGMYFNISALPTFEEGGSYYRLIMRCSRTFGNDELK